jgi:hypothetical protein
MSLAHAGRASSDVKRGDAEQNRDLVSRGRESSLYSSYCLISPNRILLLGVHEVFRDCTGDESSREGAMMSFGRRKSMHWVACSESFSSEKTDRHP